MESELNGKSDGKLPSRDGKKDLLQINVVRCLVIRGRKAAEETARSPYRQYFMCISVVTINTREKFNKGH